MSSAGSVTHWITQLKAGAPAAAQPLWERYFRRLVGLARHKLHALPRRAADEEDVALSAFDSFYRGAAHGQFPKLTDRDDLWRLLVVLTARKALDRVRHERRQKRGGGAVLGESALGGRDRRADGAPGIEQVIGPAPTPAFAAQVAEECRRLLDALGDDDLRALALAKMEGHTNDQIAAQRGCAVRTVERKLRLIRGIWEGIGEKEAGR
jgi:DNA-directed RNA polymerase specialized sigma24 family protein